MADSGAIEHTPRFGSGGAGGSCMGSGRKLMCPPQTLPREARLFSIIFGQMQYPFDYPDKSQQFFFFLLALLSTLLHSCAHIVEGAAALSSGARSSLSPCKLEGAA